MRVWHIETDAGGGLIHYAHLLCDALQETGVDVSLVTATDFELTGISRRYALRPVLRLWPHVDDGSAPRMSLSRKSRRIWRGVKYVWAWIRLLGMTRRERPDVVQVSVIRFPFVGWFLRRMAKRGIHVTQICHEFEERDQARLWTRLPGADRSGYESLSAVFLHGATVRDEFLRFSGIDGSRAHVIPHGEVSSLAHLVDPGGTAHRRYGLPPDTPVVLFFGGLRSSKGIDDLVEAMAHVRHQADAKLLIAGYPSQDFDLADMQDRIARLGLSATIVQDLRYLDLAEIGPLMRMATVVVLPYRTATASGVQQMAYAHGIPVVATSVGNLPEATEHGRTGLIVPPSDPEALANALVKLLTDPAEAKSMGAQGRLTAARDHSFADVARKIAAVYQRLDA